MKYQSVKRMLKVQKHLDFSQKITIFGVGKPGKA